MKGILFFLLILTQGICYSQDLFIPDNPYDKAGDVVKSRKSFNRERWFYEQRMYPFNYIPADAYKKAYEEKRKLRSENGFAMNGIFDTWTNLGPTTGFYSSYSNITSRMSTVKYDPNNPNIIYIGGAFGGIWKTTNGGTNWTAKSDFEVSLSSGSLAIDPVNSNILYYGTGEATYSAASYYGRGLLKSTNAGDTWVSYTSGLPSSSYTSRIVVRPNNSTHIFAAMGVNGLYRSTNSGVSWSQLVSGRCDDVIFSPTGDTAYIVGSGTGYRVSVNGGSSFTSNATLTMGTRNHIALCKSSPNVMYCSVYSGSGITVFKSVNAGSTFSQIVVGQNFNGGQAWYDFYMHVSPFDPNLAFVGSIDIWRTADGGATNFINVTNAYGGGNVHPDQQNFDFHPTNPNLVVCVNDGGIWRSTNKGSNWINTNTDLTLTQFYRIASDPSNSNHILGGTQDNGTQRTLGTINWTAAFGGDGGEVSFHRQNNSFILGETQNNGVYRSSNGGASFASASSGLTGTAAWVGPLISHPDSATVSYTARQQIFKTTNSAIGWVAISSGTSGTIRELAISKSNAAIMYATSGSNIYRSTNRGYTFSNVTSGLPVRTITSVYVHPDSSAVAVITFSGFGAGKVYKTTNTGSSWFSISGNLPDSPVNDVLIYHPNYSTSTYFAATDVGVFVSNNYGLSWIELANGLPNTVAIHLDHHLSTNKLRIGTHGRGVFEIQLSNFVASDITVIPEGFYNTVSGKMNMKDTVRAYLRNVTAPYNLVDSSKAVVDSSTFTGNFVFNNAASSVYYIVVKHRNSIETWSKSGGETFTHGSMTNYNFTNAVTQAYGNNLALKGGKYCIYSGDANRDGTVDVSDLVIIYNDGINFVSGYVQSDMNGDSFSDVSDIVITYNNATSFVSLIRP